MRGGASGRDAQPDGFDARPGRCSRRRSFSPARPPQAEPHVTAKDEDLPVATDNALVTLCGIVETSAKTEGLPVQFFTRLIWQESAFRPHAVSPAGAMGVAQFMPGTASERGLADPVRPGRGDPRFGEASGRPSAALRQSRACGGGL